MFTIPHGDGLINTNQVHIDGINQFQNLFYYGIEFLAITLALIHIISLIYLLKKFFIWRKTKDYQDFLGNPMKNSAIMGIFLTIDMTFNVIFALGNHFFLKNGPYFQLIMGPALISWIILFLFAMFFSMKILKLSFTKEFNMDKMHFGFMIHPFALAMIAVTGFGIAAFSNNFAIASIAFFLSLLPLLSAILLTVIKIVTMFQHHMKNNLPDRNFLPSTLIVMPVIMLIFMSFYRIGHYLHNSLNIHISESYFIMITIIPFAFLTWYGIFALSLIKDYFKNFKDFDVSQWGFICPIAAFTVIGFFVSKLWLSVWMPLSYFLLIMVLFGIV
ncbi:hypothetical protein EOM09_09150, partial [bacterium]|nr:hypothetical protein [bacterium]